MCPMHSPLLSSFEEIPISLNQNVVGFDVSMYYQLSTNLFDSSNMMDGHAVLSGTVQCLHRNRAKPICFHHHVVPKTDFSLVPISTHTHVSDCISVQFLGTLPRKPTQTPAFRSSEKSFLSRKSGTSVNERDQVNQFLATSSQRMAFHIVQYHIVSVKGSDQRPWKHIGQ